MSLLLIKKSIKLTAREPFLYRSVFNDLSSNIIAFKLYQYVFGGFCTQKGSYRTTFFYKQYSNCLQKFELRVYFWLTKISNRKPIIRKITK